MDYIVWLHVLCPLVCLASMKQWHKTEGLEEEKPPRMSPSFCVCSLLSPAVTRFLLKFSLRQKSASFHETVSYMAFYTSFWKLQVLGPGFLPPVISSPLLVITAFCFCLSISISVLVFHSFIVFYSNSPLLKPFFSKDPWWFPVLLLQDPRVHSWWAGVGASETIWLLNYFLSPVFHIYVLSSTGNTPLSFLKKLSCFWCVSRLFYLLLLFAVL